jgi:pyruvate dehydrogenase phosphatase
MAVPVRTLVAVTGIAATGVGGFYYANKARQEAFVPVVTTKPETKQPYTPKYYDHIPFTLLTASDVDARLRSGQMAIKANVKHVKAVYNNRLPSNNPVEDNFSVGTFQNGLIAGVYDGKYLNKKY